MASKGVEVDIVTWNTVIHGMCKDGRMKEAAQLHMDMVAAAVDPDTVTFTTRVDGKLCEDGKMKEVNELLNKMDGRKVQADSVMCNTLINSYSKKGGHGIRVQGFSPNYSVFAWLVDGFYKKNTTDALLLLPGELVKRGLPPDKSADRSLIRRLCKKGLVDLSRKIQERVRKKGRDGFNRPKTGSVATFKLANSMLDFDPSYDSDEASAVMPSSFHDISDVEFQDSWGRVWVDLGTSDYLGLDVLLNCLTQLSSE
ncbi:hypothetical protein ACQ4PT_029583 [Festuca glaucescens]